MTTTADTIRNVQIDNLWRFACGTGVRDVDPDLMHACVVATNRHGDFLFTVQRDARAACAVRIEQLEAQIRDLRENGSRTTDELNDCDVATFGLRGEFGAGFAAATAALLACVQRIKERAARAAEIAKEST